MTSFTPRSSIKTQFYDLIETMKQNFNLGIVSIIIPGESSSHAHIYGYYNEKLINLWFYCYIVHAGKGNFQIKMLSLFTIVDAKGKEFDEGELRVARGVPLFPTTLLPSEHMQ